MSDTILSYCPELREQTWPDEAVFIVDSGLPSHLLDDVPQPQLWVSGGESLKDLARIGELANTVLSHRSGRPLTLVAIGGGAVGDAVGFLASILWRGVQLWHVPTTLVSMVDSAHGGKTAVNLAGRKNQLGTFYPAQRVVICEAFLDTLPLDLREEGLAEMIKAYWLMDSDILEVFDDTARYHQLLTDRIGPHRDIWETLIRTAVEAKQCIVRRDPREQTGHRRLLNLGHTAGHGLEAIYGLAHGRAVAWGMAACAVVSRRQAELSDDDSTRLLNHLQPLLVPLPEFPQSDDRDRFAACLARDKKRDEGQLISILLEGPGAPVQSGCPDADDWWDAVRTAFAHWCNRRLTLRAPTTVNDHDIQLPPDKSRANRAAIISYLRPGPTETTGLDGRLPADVVDLSEALRRLQEVPDDESIDIRTGHGATSARFLLALSATRTGPTRLHLSPGLRNRPHQPLIDALIRGGAQVETTETGYEVRGWSDFPDHFVVDSGQSSQFASALALLAVRGTAFELQFAGELISRPYFDLTLSLITEAGVEVTRRSDGSITFAPTDELHTRHPVAIPPDTSSAVVWHALELLLPAIEAPEFPDEDHPDQRFSAIAAQLRSPEESILIDLSESPDLAPVLVSCACLLPPQVRIVGAAHLRHKESNRIDDLVAALDEIGLTVDGQPDGFLIPSGSQCPPPTAEFDPRGDHRLAMAALTLTPRVSSLGVVQAQCVRKSYPDLWRQARRSGWLID